jgi:hypothetical protein
MAVAPNARPAATRATNQPTWGRDDPSDAGCVVLAEEHLDRQLDHGRERRGGGDALEPSGEERDRYEEPGEERGEHTADEVRPRSSTSQNEPRATR